MFTVYADDHNLHADLLDPRGNEWHPSPECPERANNVLQAIRDQGFGELVLPKYFGDEKITAIHEPHYVGFLQNVWQEWVESGETASNARPDTFVGKGMRYADTQTVLGKLGRYSFDATSPFVEGSWQAIRTSANIALTAAGLVQGGERNAFALSLP